MPFLVDTNILLRSIDPDHAMNAVAVQALTMLRGQGDQLCIIVTKSDRVLERLHTSP